MTSGWKVGRQLLTVSWPSDGMSQRQSTPLPHKSCHETERKRVGDLAHAGGLSEHRSWEPLFTGIALGLGGSLKVQCLFKSRNASTGWGQ